MSLSTFFASRFLLDDETALKNTLYTHGILLEKTNFSLVICYLLEITSGLGMEAFVSSFYPSGTDLLHLCMLPQSLWVHMCIIYVIFMKPCFIGILHPLWFLKSFCFLLKRVSWNMKEWCNGDILFRNESSNVSHSLNIVPLWIFWRSMILWWYLCGSILTLGDILFL